MTDFVASEPTWVVLTDKAELIPVDVGQQFTTNQTCQVFTVEAEAMVYAQSIGWVPDEA
jgi:hypothetical protein